MIIWHWLINADRDVMSLSERIAFLPFLLIIIFSGD